ncbi:hypothetical protein [Dongia mobilis]|uniref:hypothetical protein n=1 Tax=Dongia sp. TaxID=1977262 RepID=UPI0026EE91C8
MRLWVFLAASCLLLTACMEFRLPTTATALRQGEPVRIGDNTWAAYQRYLETIGTTGQGAFATASDGKGGSSWVCMAALCTKVNEYPARAIASCEAKNPGYTCVLFAANRVPKIKFTPPQ